MKFAALLSLLFSLIFPVSASAQNYPTQPLKLIVPFPPGGGADVAARIVAQELGQQVGQGVVVENISGAGGTIGTARAAQATPDGYTLFVGTPSTHGTNPAVYPKLPYDPVKDFAPIALISTSPFILITRPDFNATSVRELVAQARAQPGHLNYASFGNGSINHLIGELFLSMTDTKAGHVPYRGGAPALADLMAGRVDYTFDGSASLGQVRAGKVKAIAVGTPKRWPVLPDVPTVSESGVPGFEAFTWYGLFAPAATPRPLVEYLNTKLNAALQTPSCKEAFAKQAIDPAGGPPEVLVRQVQNEIGKWTKVAREKGISIKE